MDNNIISLFKNNFDEKLFLIKEPMYKYTSFKIGGPADIIFFPENKKNLIEIINFCKINKIKYYVVGNCTNLLVKDNGFRGVIIKTSKYLNSIKKIDDNKIYVDVGVFLSKFANYALKESLSGGEFACSIPGSIGGGITMNAGAHGGEMKDIIEYVDILDSFGNIIKKDNNKMDFSYRKSIIQKDNLIVLGALLNLKKEKKKYIKEKMEYCIKERKYKQPVNFPSAGSIFKRPQNNFAGKLIMESGLAGYRIGDAEISKKHCGFIINKKNAKAQDVIKLMEYISEVIEKKYNIKLEPEIKIIGRD